jgi:hypothetical protein
MRLQVLLIAPFILFACSTGVELKQVSLGPFFHDNNSKVWVIDQVIVDKINYSPSNINEKDLLIFYDNNKCLFQPLKTLGTKKGKKGDYLIDSENKEIAIYFPLEKWDFKIDYMAEDTIILVPNKGSEFTYELLLIPFPEL